MTLEELKEKIALLETTQAEKNVPVTVCDLNDDSDESFNFRIIKSIDIVRIGKKDIVAIYFES